MVAHEAYGSQASTSMASRDSSTGSAGVDTIIITGSTDSSGTSYGTTTDTYGTSTQTDTYGTAYGTSTQTDTYGTATDTYGTASDTYVTATTATSGTSTDETEDTISSESDSPWVDGVDTITVSIGGEVITVQPAVTDSSTSDGKLLKAKDGTYIDVNGDASSLIKIVDNYSYTPNFDSSSS